MDDKKLEREINRILAEWSGREQFDDNAPLVDLWQGDGDWEAARTDLIARLAVAFPALKFLDHWLAPNITPHDLRHNLELINSLLAPAQQEGDLPDWQVRFDEIDETLDSSMLQPVPGMSKSFPDDDSPGNRSRMYRANNLDPIPKYCVVGTPRYFARGHSSTIYVDLVAELWRARANLFDKLEVAAKRSVDLLGHTKVKLAVECPSVKITPESTTVSVEVDAKTEFLCRPLADCPPGAHDALVLITEAGDSGVQIDTVAFAIKVRDYAFDHVSRPALTKIASAISGLAGASLFVLTFLEKLDKALGLSGGTAALLVMGFFGFSHFMNYNRHNSK